MFTQVALRTQTTPEKLILHTWKLPSVYLESHFAQSKHWIWQKKCFKINTQVRKAAWVNMGL